MPHPLADDIGRYLADRARWHPLEIPFWVAALASVFLLTNKHLILELYPFDIGGQVADVACSVELSATFLLARRIVNSPFGLSLRSVRGNPLRSSAIGISVNGRLVGIYTIAAGYAGIAGALLTQTSQFVSLDVLSLERSADVLLALVIGGTGYLYGGIVGAVLFKLMQDYLANLTPQYWQFWIGLVLVIIVVVGRERMTNWSMPARAFLARLGPRAAHPVETARVPAGVEP